MSDVEVESSSVISRFAVVTVVSVGGEEEHL
jgi:hypothetical protein